jgi:hypothetical protein
MSNIRASFFDILDNVCWRSNMKPPRDVFDTNHDGKLDASGTTFARDGVIAIRKVRENARSRAGVVRRLPEQLAA